MLNPRKKVLVCLAILGASFGAVLSLLHGRAFPSSAVAVRGVKSPMQTVASPPPVKSVRSFTLSPEEAATRRLTVGEVHRYSFTLHTGELLTVFVDQMPVRGEAIDVAVGLNDPHGRRLYTIDSPTGARDTEESHLIAESSGIYSVDVEGEQTEGTYRIWCHTAPRADAIGNLKAHAEKSYFQAKTLAQQKPPDYEGAASAFLAAEDLWRRAGDSKRQGQALEKAGFVLISNKLRKWDIIFILRQRLLRLYRSIGDREGEARALVALGLACQGLGRTEQSERFYQEALAISDPQFPEPAADAMKNLGGLLNERGQKFEALEYLDKSLPYWQSIGRQADEWEVLNYRGLVYKSLGNNDKAMENFQAAELIAERLNDEDRRAQGLDRIAEVCQLKGKLDEAILYHNRSFELRRKVGSLRGEAVNLAGRSLIYREMKDFGNAMKLQQDALNVFRRINDQGSEATAYSNIGRILLDQGDPLQAIANFEQGAKLARAQGNREGEITALYGEGLAQRERRNPLLARGAVQKALQLIEEMSSGTLSEGVDSFFVVARESSYELLIDLLVGSPAQFTSQENKEKAFETSEKARWRHLLNSLAPGRMGGGLLKQLAPDLFAEHARLVEKIERTEEQRLRQRGLQADQLKETQQAMVVNLRNLEGRIRVRAAQRLSFVSVSEAQALLDQDTVVLEYFLGRRRSFLWLLTASGLEVFELPARSLIEERCLEYYALVSNSQSQSGEKQAAVAAERLGALLLRPVVRQLAARKKIVIIPDGVIHMVPFAALPAPEPGVSGKDKAVPLLKTHQVVYLPSLSVLRAIRSEMVQRQRPSGFVAVIAAPALGAEEYPPLAYSRQEGEEVLGLVPPAEGFGAFGSEATRALVFSGKLKNYRYHLFSTHGEDHPEQPELSGVVLSRLDRGGRPRSDHLWLQDIENLDLPSDLVVVSACRTAVGKKVRGEGYVGLPQGFLSAGAARVIVSLWNVNDKSTAALIVRLFRGILRDKLAPAEALRVAQLWMAESKDWNSPYYWAGFELQGEWN